MRLDPDHIRSMALALSRTDDGEPQIKVSTAMMREARDRLSMWEMGLLATCLAKAASASRLRPEQRVLLALFAHREVE